MSNQHTLDSPIFIILALAGIISLPIYLITVIHVLTLKSLEGSFFKIYVASTVINIFSYLNRFLVVKLPLFTCGDGCLLSEWMLGKNYWYLQISLGLHWNNMIVQVVLQCIIALDRFVVIVLGDRVKRYWSKFYVLSIVLAYLVPWIYSYPILLKPARFDYSLEVDTFLVNSSSVSLTPLYTILIWTMMITTGLSFFFNLTTFLKFFLGSVKLSRAQSAIEKKLFINCVVQMLSEAFVLVILNMQSNARAADPHEHDFSRVLMAFSSDLLLLFPPYVLIFTCNPLRKKMLFWKKVVTEPTSVDSHMYG